MAFGETAAGDATGDATERRDTTGTGDGTRPGAAFGRRDPSDPGEVVAIIGAGTMGSGIAQVCLARGHAVHLHDHDPAVLAGARRRIAAGLDRWVVKGALEPGMRDAALRSLHLAGSLGAAAEPASFVIEAAAEDPDVKRAVFGELDEATTGEAVLATNTSSLSVADCAAVTRHPERVLGLHFFNPAPLMALVEVALTERTNPHAAARAVAFVERLGKTALRCADSPGFIVNRVGRPYLVEAVRILVAGEGTIEGIDAALEAAGYPMGPFRLIDLIGLDVDLAIDERLYRAFGEAPRFRPVPLQAELVAAGRLGRKVGHGFHRYAGREIVPDPPRATAPPTTLPPEAIVERLELAMVNEAYRAVEDGVAVPADVDTAMRLGAGHPLGPFELVDRLGLRRVVERLRAIREASGAGSGDQYDVAPLLWQMATV